MTPPTGKASARRPRKQAGTTSGRLRIGDNWNAISIIALAQSNPLKAVAEFVENSIDAGARNVTIVRGKERGESYLSISDDGEGVRRNDDGAPDFRYVATHICDSFKRRLKHDGAQGIQGEFGIGLLSFWTLGENLFMTGAADDGVNYQMHMERGNPGYRITRLRTLVAQPGTELKIRPLLPGIRGFNGDRLEWYLASELRDRIRDTGVKVRILDRQSRKQFEVQPRQYDGELLHELRGVPSPNGEVYLELYLTGSGSGEVGLYRSGTRVLPDLAALEDFTGSVWSSGALEGVVDAPFLHLTPGTRSGLIRDAEYRTFCEALAPLAAHLRDLVDALREAEEQHASKRLLQRLQRAFREAILALPVEEYDFFDVRTRGAAGRADAAQPGTADPEQGTSGAAAGADGNGVDALLLTAEQARESHPQRDFFDFPGPLFSARIAPRSSVLRVGDSRTLRAVCRDRSRRNIDRALTIEWRLLSGAAQLSATDGELITLTAGAEPGLVQLGLTVTEDDVVCTDEAVVTVTDELVAGRGRRGAGSGLPGYTFEHAPGALWRSRHDEERNLIVVNSGHRDFVFANRSNALKLRYVGRLYAKELVRRNFPGASADELLERMIELTLYMEEHLR